MFPFSHVLWVGAGGFVGAVLRYLVGGTVQWLSKSLVFPYGTLAVNLIGCLVIGVLSELVAQKGVLSSEARAFVLVGVLGSFTTFSTFGNETFNLLREGMVSLAFLSVGIHLVCGLAAVWLGVTIASAL